MIDDEPKCDVFEFDDLCSVFECLIGTASGDSHPTSLELKPLIKSIKHSFFGPINLYLLLSPMT